MTAHRPPDPKGARSTADRPKAPTGDAVVPASGAEGSVPSGRAVSRPAFREVIRRAAELSLSDADADDDLTEDEVIRIATELGLPEHHVQRALFELPELRVQPRWSDRHYGSPVFSATRVIAGDAGRTLRRIEDYLITREYLQLVRRRGDTLAFVPADDTISSLARAVLRPHSRHIVARASRVVVGSHAIPGKGTHVRAKRFRNRVHAAKYELVSLLDRLEHGERLDPPPAPWRRKLQLRLFGDRSR